MVENIKDETPTNKIIKLPLKITVGDLATILDVEVPKLIKVMMSNGIVANVNELVDYDIAAIISEELGIKTELDHKAVGDEELVADKLSELLQAEQENSKNLKQRPPIVTVLGHVDHGKTTLLDTLKKTKLAEKEAGGITQHISSYQVKEADRLITFIDTPGHEAFQAMRERGASVADITVLVVAADDGVKPQTEEVIKFLLEKKIPTVVAINKIDKPDANVNRVKQELAEHGLLLEGFGGDIPVNEISAKNNTGLEKLLETILLLADVNELTADYDREALGIVLEARKDSQKGALANIIIKTGTLRVGQDILIGNISGRVRKIEDYSGNPIPKAPPSMPITIYGLPEVPKSNEILQVLDGKQKKRIKLTNAETPTKDLDSTTIISDINASLINKYPIILKADTQGSLEAIEQVLQTIKSDEIVLKIIQKGVGPITEKDIQTAQSGKAVLYGFNIFPTQSALQLAEKVTASIKTFSIIYELIEDVKTEMSNRLEPEIKRMDLGRLKVLAIFKNMKKSMIVGGKVMNGKIIKGEFMEILREKQPIGSGKLVQLQHNKEDVTEVKENFECGLTLEGSTKIEVGDVLLCYKEEEVARKI
jgi:translation initiation factor IF-2